MAFRLAAAARVEQIVAAIRRMIDPDVAIAGWRPLAGGTGVLIGLIVLALIG